MAPKVLGFTRHCKLFKSHHSFRIGFGLVAGSGFAPRFKLIVRHLHGFERLVGLGLVPRQSMLLLLALFVRSFVLDLLWPRLLRWLRLGLLR